ncbi:MAG: class I SAM-dependent methyltransferase [Pseudomonadota bacterium]
MKLIRTSLRYVRTNWPRDFTTASLPKPSAGLSFRGDTYASFDDFPFERFARQHQYEERLIDILEGWPLGLLKIPGYCEACTAPTTFSFKLLENETPNWRESLACNTCHLINRWRVSAYLAGAAIASAPAGSISYITERRSPLFDWLSDAGIDLLGSEYFGPDATPGAYRFFRGANVMHQDVTRLSFDDNSLGVVMTFDVLEHIPDYAAAIGEFLRTLRPGGQLVLSVPFSITSESTVTRATVNAEGEVTHLLEPEYHGDPLNGEGVLCFYNFGWDLMQTMRQAGFEQVRLMPIWSPQLGYLGVGQSFIIGTKPAPSGLR